MDTIETLLKNLNGGQLQRLALELLPHMHTEWKNLIALGGCEGGYRTRKGTPDIWCEDLDGNLIYIQATGNSAYGKMLEDTQKSVDKLVNLNRNINASCISFLNYEPDSKEVSECRSYCQPHGINFIFYNNGQIAHYLKSHPLLCERYLGVILAHNIIKLSLDYELYYEQIDYFSSILNLRSVIRNDLNALCKELAKNAFEHGNASSVELFYVKGKIVIYDKSTQFNLLEFTGKPKGGGGGSHTLRHLVTKYNDLLDFSYAYDSTTGKNKVEIRMADKETYKFIVDHNCSMTIPKVDSRIYRSDLNIEIPSHCETVKIHLDFNAFILSDFIIAFKKIIWAIPESYNIELTANGEIPSYTQEYIKEHWKEEYKRIKLINVK